jgi:hypothetical protein
MATHSDDANMAHVAEVADTGVTALSAPIPEPTTFSTLPPETRSIIWKMILNQLPGPRNIHLWQTISNPFTINRRFTSNKHILLQTTAVHPTLLSVNRESRALVLKKYVVLLGPNNFSLSLNVEQDTIYVLSPGPKPAPLHLRPLEKGGDYRYAPYNLVPCYRPVHLKFVFVGEAQSTTLDPLQQVDFRSFMLSLPNLRELANLLGLEWSKPVFTQKLDRRNRLSTYDRYLQPIDHIRWGGRVEKFDEEKVWPKDLVDVEDGFCVADKKILFLLLART